MKNPGTPQVEPFGNKLELRWPSLRKVKRAGWAWFGGAVVGWRCVKIICAGKMEVGWPGFFCFSRVEI